MQRLETKNPETAAFGACSCLKSTRCLKSLTLVPAASSHSGNGHRRLFECPPSHLETYQKQRPGRRVLAAWQLGLPEKMHLPLRPRKVPSSSYLLLSFVFGFASPRPRLRSKRLSQDFWEISLTRPTSTVGNTHKKFLLTLGRDLRSSTFSRLTQIPRTPRSNDLRISSAELAAGFAASFPTFERALEPTRRVTGSDRQPRTFSAKMSLPKQLRFKLTSHVEKERRSCVDLEQSKTKVRKQANKRASKRVGKQGSERGRRVRAPRRFGSEEKDKKSWHSKNEGCLDRRYGIAGARRLRCRPSWQKRRGRSPR